MAWGNFILDKGFRLADNVTKFRAVKATATHGVCTPVTANTDEVLGFAQFGVTDAEILHGKGASVRLLGITEAEASGAIAVGDRVTLDAAGTVSVLVGSSGKRVVGKCVGNPSTNAGDRIALFFDTLGGLA